MTRRMLTKEDLKFIQRKPLESELSLITIVDFYDEFLINKLFEFKLDYPTQPVVKLCFERDNLCHLLGFQHVFEDEPNATDYGGVTGYNLIRSGAVTMETFKQKHTREKYKEHRERILYFAYIYQLLINPTVILFSNEDLNTNISTEFILHDHQNNRYLHLGVDKHENTANYYFPRTFFVRKKNEFIIDQTPITILGKTEIVMT